MVLGGLCRPVAQGSGKAAEPPQTRGSGMTRGRVGSVSVVSHLLLLLFLLSSVSAEVLFGPVVVPNGQIYSGTFPMYCRCTAYFLEVTNGSSKIPKVILNGEPVLELEGEVWRRAVVQVELREDGPNEIEIRVGRTEERGGSDGTGVRGGRAASAGTDAGVREGF